MEIVKIHDWQIKELRIPSIVNHCNRILLRYLGKTGSWEGCPLFEAELSFNIVFEQLQQLHTKILDYLKCAKDETKSFQEVNPMSLMMPDDRIFGIDDIEAAKLKLSAEAHLLGALASADCIIDHIVKYSVELCKKSPEFLPELALIPDNKKDKGGCRRKILKNTYNAETGGSVEGIIRLIEWRNSRVHETHFHLTLDRKNQCVIYSTSMNEFLKKSRRKFDSRKLDDYVKSLREYLNWWCRKTEAFIKQQLL